MLTVTGRMIQLPRCIAARPPWMATGTIGAPALIAMMKPPFLNGSISSVLLRVPSGKIRNELPARSDSRAGLDRSHRRFLVAAVDRNEPAHPERARQHRNAIDLVLVEDVHSRVQRRVKDRRIDVALMVAAVDRRAIARQVLGAGDTVLDAGERQSQAHAAVAEDVQQVRPAEERGQQHADEPGDEDVEGNRDVGRDGSDGGNQH